MDTVVNQNSETNIEPNVEHSDVHQASETLGGRTELPDLTVDMAAELEYYESDTYGGVEIFGGDTGAMLLEYMGSGGYENYKPSDNSAVYHIDMDGEYDVEEINSDTDLDAEDFLEDLEDFDGGNNSDSDSNTEIVTDLDIFADIEPSDEQDDEQSKDSSDEQDDKQGKEDSSDEQDDKQGKEDSSDEQDDEHTVKKKQIKSDADHSDAEETKVVNITEDIFELEHQAPQTTPMHVIHEAAVDDSENSESFVTEVDLKEHSDDSYIKNDAVSDTESDADESFVTDDVFADETDNAPSAVDKTADLSDYVQKKESPHSKAVDKPHSKAIDKPHSKAPKLSNVRSDNLAATHEALGGTNKKSMTKALSEYLDEY